MRFLQLASALILGFMLVACDSPPETTTEEAATTEPEGEKFGVQVIDGVKIKKVEGFGGVIAERYEDHPVTRWRNLFRNVLAQLDAGLPVRELAHLGAAQLQIEVVADLPGEGRARRGRDRAGSGVSRAQRLQRRRARA